MIFLEIVSNTWLGSRVKDVVIRNYKMYKSALTMPIKANCQAAQFLKLAGPVEIVRQRRVVAGLVNRLIGGR